MHLVLCLSLLLYSLNKNMKLEINHEVGSGLRGNEIVQQIEHAMTFH